jgi:hypothetical protein
MNQSDPTSATAAPHTEQANTENRTSPPPHRLNRRAFLGSALTGLAAAAVAACGDSATPSPLNTPAPVSPLNLPGKQYLPLVANEAGLAATPTPTTEPTLTPTPAKTATPTPEPPTPTPEATPFPPGPPSKLGLFIGHNDPELFRLLETQAVTVVKTLELDANFLRQIKETSPNTKIIGRIDLPQIDLPTLDPLPAARAFVDRVLVYADDPARRPYIDGWEAYNEPVAANADEMAKLAAFEAERTRLLGERGIRSVIGNFGTGQPPLELWPAFFPALQAAQQYDGWLGLHEYSAPTIYYLSTRENMGRHPGVAPGDTGWLTLRYRKVYNDILRPAGLALPLVLTELGVDGLVAERPGPPDAMGWKDFQGYWAENGYGLWGPGAYIEQLVWYDNAMRQDDYVIGGTIYALAPTAGWESYDIRGPASMVLEQYLSVHAPS